MTVSKKKFSKRKNVIIANRLRNLGGKINFFVEHIVLPFGVLSVYVCFIILPIILSPFCRWQIVEHIFYAYLFGVGLILFLLYFIVYGLNLISYFLIISIKYKKMRVIEIITSVIGNFFLLFITFAGIAGIIKVIWMKFF
jgi:hypothetical protein